MSNIARISMVAALAVLATAVGAHAAPPPVLTTSGPVQGVEAQGVVVYKGLPYAAAPVGELRWRAPQPAPTWQGVRVADRFGNSCMQNAAPVGGPLTVSEDCLYLNVWRPAGERGARLPVMFYIHGGGFNIGSSTWPQTEGSSLARHGVVLVSINYRMGKFGFFAHPALTREGAGGEVGNYGLMDMVAALKWVKANAAAFGGDPDNVTIFGESAGGMAVDFLMESPDARGLFNKAIVESGGGRNAYDSFAEAEAKGAASAQAWGVTGDSPAALRAVPAATILGNASMSAGGASPMIDGKVVPEDILAAFRAGRVAHVPYMIGTNAYEGGSFGAMGDSIAKANAARWSSVEAVYDGYGTHRADMIRGEFATDAFMTEPARALARAAAANGQPAYVYQFSYLRPSQRDGKIPGPLHFDEVYVVFDSMTTSPPPVSDDKAAVEAMETRWTSFARTGVPSTDWPQFKPGAEAVLDFTNDGPVSRKDFKRAKLDVAEALAEPKP